MKEFIANEKTVKGVGPTERLAIYNGMDAAVTLRLASLIEAAEPMATFARLQQYPALVMMLRGIRIDLAELRRVEGWLAERAERLERVLGRITTALAGEPLNPRSPKQMRAFWEACGLPLPRKTDRGEETITFDQKRLERAADDPAVAPLVRLIVEIRQSRKLASTFASGISPDGRIRCSYRVVGTESGRWSSGKAPDGTGTNLQNIAKELRSVFVADEGYDLVYADLEQAEARVVAYLSGDEGYIDACENSGDLHTTVCRMIWPELPWTGDIAKDRAIAEKHMIGRLSARHLAKSSAHATNYGATPRTLAATLRIPVAEAERFQRAYFRAFPKIKEWHKRVQLELNRTRTLTNPLGRRRRFLGRANDEGTWKEALAFLPQSTIADILNLGLLRIWRDLEPEGLQLLAQVHDAILFQVPEGRSDLVEAAIRRMTIDVPVDGRVMRIPVSAKVGKRWSEIS